MGKAFVKKVGLVAMMAGLSAGIAGARDNRQIEYLFTRSGTEVLEKWAVRKGEWVVRDGVLWGGPGSRIELPGPHSWDFEFSTQIHLASNQERTLLPFQPSTTVVLEPDICFCFGRWMVEMRRDSILIGEWVNDQKGKKRLAETVNPFRSLGGTHTFAFQVRLGWLRVFLDGEEQLGYDIGSQGPNGFQVYLNVGGMPVSFSEVSVHTPDVPELWTDRQGRRVVVAAVYRPWQFNRRGGLKNHHFIVANKGRAGRLGLLNTFAGDSAIHAALVEVGAIPGNNLTQRVWTQRRKKEAPEPRVLAQGTPIRVGVWKKGQRFEPPDLLKDRSGKAFEFRFAGNLHLIPHWRSGCVICLQSCPGGKIGHAHYSIRDHYEKKARFEPTDPPNLHGTDTVAIVFTPEPAR